MSPELKDVIRRFFDSFLTFVSVGFFIFVLIFLGLIVAILVKGALDGKERKDMWVADVEQRLERLERLEKAAWKRSLEKPEEKWDTGR